MTDHGDETETNGNFIDLTNELTPSGRYIAAHRVGDLAPLSTLILQRKRAVAQLAEVEGALRGCNDEIRLAELSSWCSSKNKDFEVELTKKIRDLEIGKDLLNKQLASIDDDLVQYKSYAPTGSLTMNMAPPFSLVPQTPPATPVDPLIELRNRLINQNPSRPHLEICKSLDFGLVPPRQYLPDTWYENFGVSTFVEAYHHKKCRPLVQKLISSAKRKGSYRIPRDRQHRSQ